MELIRAIILCLTEDISVMLYLQILIIDLGLGLYGWNMEYLVEVPHS